jgi:hypothetical protein
MLPKKRCFSRHQPVLLIPANPRENSLWAQSTIAAVGIVPDRRAISRPLSRITSVGMDWMPNRRVRPRSASVLSLASRNAGSSWAVAAENAGAICRHGPHHGAQKSTSNGMSDRSASATKFAAVRTTGSPFRSAMPQRPHFASANILRSGTRLVVPHAEQPNILVFASDIETLAAISWLLARPAVLVTADTASSPGRVGMAIDSGAEHTNQLHRRTDFLEKCARSDA